MKKAIIATLIASVLVIPICLLCACKDNGKKIAAEINRDTTLELGFLENVEGKDLSFLVTQDGVFGGYGYYNSGYQEGDTYYVRYTVTAYPDYADGGKVVTHIECTDPEVKFFGGNTVNDCSAMFNSLKSKGFKVEYFDSSTRASKGNVTITNYLMGEKSVIFSYKVGNRQGIVF